MRRIESQPAPQPQQQASQDPTPTIVNNRLASNQNTLDLTPIAGDRGSRIVSRRDEGLLSNLSISRIRDLHTTSRRLNDQNPAQVGYCPISDEHGDRNTILHSRQPSLTQELPARR